MTRYLVETFAPRSGEVVTMRTRNGAPVRVILSLYLPAEETMLHLVEAEGREEVDQAVRAAGLEADRITRVVAVSGLRAEPLSSR